MKLFLWFLIALVCGAPATLPSEDDFYKAPEGFENEAPGTILKIRKNPFEVKSILLPVKLANFWQLLVRSQDVFGNATAITTTIYEPHNANSSRLVSYQIAEDAANMNCAPSYANIGGGGFGTLETKFEMFLIQSVLDQGFYVVSPDYEGVASTFTVGPTSGYATLDSIRAALQTSNETGIDKDAQVAMWGYSGGTIASGWAAGMAPKYAEDLKDNLIGAALGGFVTNITATAEAIDGSVFVGLAPNAIAGLSNQYPQMKRFIADDQIRPGMMDKFQKAHNICLLNSIIDYAFENIFDGDNSYAKNGWNLFTNPLVQGIINQSTLAIESTKEVMPEIPLFVYHGMRDEIVPFKETQRTYDAWCDQGIKSFEFAVSKSEGHILGLVEGSGAALRWLARLFDNEDIVEGCHRTVRESNLLYPHAFSGTSDILATAIRNVLGEKIGPIIEKRLEYSDEYMKGDYELESLMRLIRG